MDPGYSAQILEFGLLKYCIDEKHSDQGPHFTHQVFLLQAEVNAPLWFLFDATDVNIACEKELSKACSAMAKRCNYSI